MRSGLRGGTGPWGQYKTPGMLGFIRAQRGRARSALFSRVQFISVYMLFHNEQSMKPNFTILFCDPLLSAFSTEELFERLRVSFTFIDLDLVSAIT